MSTVGHTLKKNRELRKLSIQEVCEELKISRDILIKLENDEIYKTPDMVFYIGHLRSYSNLMDLNTENIIKDFKNQISSFSNNTSENILKPSFDNNKFNFVKIFSGSIILVIFLSFYYLFINNDYKKQEYALVPDIPEIYIPTIEKTELIIAQNKKEKSIEKINLQNASSANASNKINTDNENKKFITLKFLNSTWIQIRDNSENIILSQLMEKDEEYSYGVNLGYNLTVGNAGNILVLIDNDVRGKLGQYGEILDSYIVDSKFSN